jgi:hypothetical protein
MNLLTLRLIELPIEMLGCLDLAGHVRMPELDPKGRA